MNLCQSSFQTLKKLIVALSDPRLAEGVETVLQTDAPMPTSSLAMALRPFGMAGSSPELSAPFWETDAVRPA